MTNAAASLQLWVTRAKDTSTGPHPTGWTSGQLWSETAEEWRVMYASANTSALDNSAGQPLAPSGTGHPTGWTAGQLWSETALEWNTMWRTEWFNARDPQGFSHSYPGQAANAVFWSQSAQYWRGQYDAAYTNRYNEGYSAGSAALTPPTNPVQITTSVSVPTGADGWTGNLTSVAADRAGQWLAMAFAARGTIVCGARLTNSGGGLIGNYNGYFNGLDRAGDTTSGNPRAGDWWQGALSAGGTVHVQGARAGVTGNTINLYLYFIPTVANPH